FDEIFRFAFHDRCLSVGVMVREGAGSRRETAPGAIDHSWLRPGMFWRPPCSKGRPFWPAVSRLTLPSSTRSLVSRSMIASFQHAAELRHPESYTSGKDRVYVLSLSAKYHSIVCERGRNSAATRPARDTRRR